MEALQPQTAAPHFSLPDHEGIMHSLNEMLAHGPLLLVFYKVTCPVCQYALPFFERLHRRLGNDPPRVCAVSQNSLDHTSAFGREFGVETLPTLFDGEDDGYTVSNAFQLSNVPTSFLIETDGKIALTSVGWSKDDTAAMAKRLGEASGNPGLVLFEPAEDVVTFRPG